MHKSFGAKSDEDGIESWRNGNRSDDRHAAAVRETGQMGHLLVLQAPYPDPLLSPAPALAPTLLPLRDQAVSVTAIRVNPISPWGEVLRRRASTCSNFLRAKKNELIGNLFCCWRLEDIKDVTWCVRHERKDIR